MMLPHTKDARAREGTPRRLRCGLCNVYIEDWPAHMRSPEHLRAVGDPLAVRLATLQSQADILGRIAVGTAGAALLDEIRARHAPKETLCS